MALYLKMPLLLLVIALIPVLETISVIIQVAYFKKTGNRIFKMAPLHHHFELSGWKESKVVIVFSLITLVSSFLKNPVDFILVITVLLLLSIGLVMVLSASSPSALSESRK